MLNRSVGLAFTLSLAVVGCGEGLVAGGLRTFSDAGAPDAGNGAADAGQSAEPDAGTDAGSSAAPDAGADAGQVGRPDAGADAGARGAADGGSTGGADAGASPDAGSAPDAGASSSVWLPPPNISWQWQLTGTIDLTVAAAVFDIDLFESKQTDIDALHGQGKRVICYFSAGTYENWRPDASAFPASALGSGVAGWPGENWLDTRDATVRGIMQARLDLAVQKKCDGVEPDNVDGYLNSPGFPLTATTQLDFNRFIAGEAHRRNLSVGLKNDVDQVADLEPDFDWALNEECSKYSECGTLAPFTSAGKAVLHCEYTSSCPAAVPGFSTILKKLGLDSWRVVCP